MTKPGLTVDQHRVLGAELADLRNRLIESYVLIANAYPQNLPAVTALRSAATKVDKARSELDGRLSREHPAEFSCDTYYPVRRDQ